MFGYSSFSLFCIFCIFFFYFECRKNNLFSDLSCMGTCFEYIISLRNAHFSGLTNALYFSKKKKNTFFSLTWVTSITKSELSGLNSCASQSFLKILTKMLFYSFSLEMYIHSRIFEYRFSNQTSFLCCEFFKRLKINIENTYLFSQTKNPLIS